MKPATRLWPGMIFVLIGVNFAVVAATIYAARSDDSFAVEPGYDRKAAAWNEAAAQLRANQRLGWRVAVSVPPDARSLILSLTDRDGAPITGASVAATIFHSAQASRRADLSLSETRPGSYTAPADLTRPGFWQLRITATRGPDTFTAAIEHPVAPPPAASDTQGRP